MKIFWVLCVGLVPLWVGSQTQGEKKAALSQAELLSPLVSVSEESTSRIPLGVAVRVAQGWHTYWRFAGDMGKPLSLQWQVPSPLRYPESLNWPPPRRVLWEGFYQFVYEGFVLLTTHIPVPKSFWKNPPAVVDISAKLQWLICKHLCIPMTEDLHLSLPVRGVEEVHSPTQKLFHTWEKKNPKPKLHPMSLQSLRGQWQVTLKAPAPGGGRIKDFFPLSRDMFSPQKPSFKAQPAPGTNTLRAQQHSFRVKKSPHFKEPVSARALAVFEEDGGQTQAQYFEFHPQDSPAWPLLYFLLLAFLGGGLLNFMPCVLPIVFLKLSNTLEECQKDRRGFVWSNLMYSGGVVSSFVGLAGLLLILKKSGQAIGWGFQMQSPYFLMFMIYLFLLISLSFMGWFFIPSLRVPFLYRGGRGFKHFLTGVLSTTAASPCTVPFMGAAMAYATQGGGLEIVSVFVFLGLGLSFPYLLLSVFPRAFQWLPPPGKWNESLKHFMVFPMLTTCAWLIHLLNYHHPDILFGLLAGLLALSLAFWFNKNQGIRSRTWTTLTWLLMGLALGGPFAGLYLLQQEKTSPPAPPAVSAAEGVWEPFSLQKWQALKDRGRQPVFVQFSAQWCLTCKWNERVTLQNAEVKNFFKQRGFRLLRGDWTHKNPEITHFLERYQRTGIPFYLYLPARAGKHSLPGGEVLLPELLTPSLLLRHLKTDPSDDLKKNLSKKEAEKP